MRMINWGKYFLLIAIAIVLLSSCGKTLPSDLISIQQVRNESNDVRIIKKVVADYATKYTPGWVYTIDNICISGDFATADIYDQNTGGERILKKEAGNWKIISSTGGGYSETNLTHFGVPDDTAKELLQNKNCINHEKD